MSKDYDKAASILQELGLIHADFSLYILDYAIDQHGKSLGLQLSWPADAKRKALPGFYLKVFDSECANSTPEIYFDGSKQSFTMFRQVAQAFIEVSKWSLE